MIKCNLTEEEQAEILPRFPEYQSTQILEQSKTIFKTYIFYDTWGRKNFREYYCPNCGRFEAERGGRRDIYEDDPFSYHHGDMVSCPICGIEGELICLGKAKTMQKLWEEHKMIFFHERDGKLLAQEGYLSRSYSPDDLDPLPKFSEVRRYYMEPGKRARWKRSAYDAVKNSGWESMKSFDEPFPKTHYYGTKLKVGECYAMGMECIENTSMRYCMLVDYLMNEYMVDGLDMTEPVRGMMRYLGEYTRRPQMEMLVKLGHEDVITALLDGDSMERIVDWRAKNPNGFFRMSKQEYKAFRDTGAKIREFKAWRETEQEMPFVEFAGLVKLFGRHTSQFIARFGKDPRRKKLCSWYERQEKVLRDKTWTWWMDTLRSEEQLGNNVNHDNVLMPEDLRARHDEAAAMVAKLVQQREEELVKSYGKVLFRQLKSKYEWTNGVLMIRVPRCAEEIENEGRLLRHCVAGYADRHIKGKTTILFMRWCDDPETAYMTIEVNGADIRQVHGYKNDIHTMRPREIHGDMLDEWTAWVKQGSPRTTTGKPVRIKTTEEKTA